MTTLADRPTERSVGRVPPHSREAEESVLGAILLSMDAANQVMDKVVSADFYVPAHQSIFEALLTLYNANQPIDVITVTEELRRAGSLDRVGGAAYLAGLAAQVPSVSSIDYYADIVVEHGLRRSLIRAGSVVTDLAFRIEDEVVAVLDRAEQEILGVAERRAGDGMLAVGPLFQAAIEEIEALEARGSEVTGLATGFRDLDKKLAGLQPANLVVIAARPSMGKSAITLNIATNISTAGRTVALFSLEMSKEEIVQRILSSVGRVDSTKLRTGQLGQANWERVVAAASRMFKAPIYIDDSSVVTVTEIRARCRRLKRLRGLDLVVVDYLQLMQGANRENRQQEIADISRGLKNLARELAVPIIAVSQLNRALESREDKRPRLSDLRESGCLTGDTMVVRADTNERIRLDDLAASGVTNVPVWTLDEHFRLIRGTMTRAFSSGSKPVFEMLFASGKRLKASANHPFLTVTGWKPFEDLRVGDHLATARRLYQSGAYQDLDVIPAEVWEYVRTKAMPEAGVTSRQLANRLGISYRGSDLFTSGVSRGKMARIAEALNDDTLWDLALSDVCWGRIVAIEPLGIEPVYDATVAGTHNFIGNGIVAHNSIEQDADVVMFIYRHEYYHPEDMEKKGMAEVIIAKHRAGGTGSIDMTFLPDFTRFADLGRDVS